MDCIRWLWAVKYKWKFFAYLRKYEGETYLVVVNFSDEHEEFSSEFVKTNEIIANIAFPEELTHVALTPWAAFVVGVS